MSAHSLAELTPVCLWLYKEIGHAAGRALRVRGRNLGELFTNAAWAMTMVQAAIGNEAGVEVFADSLYYFGISATGAG